MPVDSFGVTALSNAETIFFGITDAYIDSYPLDFFVMTNGGRNRITLILLIFD